MDGQGLSGILLQGGEVAMRAVGGCPFLGRFMRAARLTGGVGGEVDQSTQGQDEGEEQDDGEVVAGFCAHGVNGRGGRRSVSIASGKKVDSAAG